MKKKMLDNNGKMYYYTNSNKYHNKERQNYKALQSDFARKEVGG
jgi:hypothetical protein